MLGYKAAIAYNKNVVVTLEIPEDALTNIERKNVSVKEYAKHRCNKAKVLKIEDEDGKEYEEAETQYYDKSKLTYKLNETVSVHQFDMKLENVCSTGIHFFLTKRVAELYHIKANKKNNDSLYTTYNLPTIKNGLYTEWYENGNKYLEYTCVNYKVDGVYQSWYVNGQKYREFTYVNGRKHGLFTIWHKNGIKQYECTYVNGIILGNATHWNENGMLIREVQWDRNGAQIKNTECCVIS